jgi:hypothetical protein
MQLANFPTNRLILVYELSHQCRSKLFGSFSTTPESSVVQPEAFDMLGTCFAGDTTRIDVRAWQETQYKRSRRRLLSIIVPKSRGFRFSPIYKIVSPDYYSDQ